jgi:H+/Cl- antiporter ClcA
MLLYFSIGIVFGLFVEVVSEWLKKYKMWPYKPGSDPYNIWMRLVIVLIWPIGIVVFTISFIKGYRGKQ